MSLVSRILEALRGAPPTPTGPPAPLPPVLRNKPGGMAWIKGIHTDFGADVLNGRAVKTVRLNDRGSWVIDPPQLFCFTRHCYNRRTMESYSRGQSMRVDGLEDEFLEPWKDIGDEERSEELAFQPKVPTLEPGKVPA